MIVFEDIILRSVTSEDTTFLSRLYASTRQEELAVTGWTSEEIDSFLGAQFEVQTMYYNSQFPHGTFNVICIGDNPAGRLYLDTRGDEVRIVDISLLPAFRGCGIGRYLLEKTMGVARRKGLAVRIHVEYNNSAMGLYKQLGFKKINENGVYFLMEWRADSSCDRE